MEKWLGILFVFGVGVLFVAVGVASLNLLVTLAGAVFVGGSILGTSEFRRYLKFVLTKMRVHKSTPKEAKGIEVTDEDLIWYKLIEKGDLNF